MKLEEALVKVREGKGYEARLPWRAGKIVIDQKDDEFNKFTPSEILSDKWFVWREPKVVEIDDLAISKNAYSDPMYGFVAYCHRDTVEKLSGKKWKATFTEVIDDQSKREE